MSDLFHEDIPDSIIKEIFDVMNKCPQHIFQVLTKRSERLKILSPHLYWTRNIWMGVTIENADFLKRIPDLQKSDAYIKFLSLEPFIGPIKNLPLDNIDWIIVGGESGPKARPMSIEWVRDIRDRCEEEKVSFFFKQWGGIKKHASGRVLDGKIWDEKPTLIRKANCTEV
jgi:protein gp37